MKYRGKIVDDPNGPPPTRAITSLEEKLGRKLPEDYRDFLVNVNGGYVDYEFLAVFEDGHRETLSFPSFNSIGVSGGWDSNPFELDELRKQEGFPQEGVLPIAKDGGGSNLFLDLRTDYKIVALVHGLPEWTGLRQQDSLVTVASSFEEYWNSLKITDAYVEEFIENYDPKYGNPELAAEWLDSGNKSWRDSYAQLWQKCVLEAHEK